MRILDGILAIVVGGALDFAFVYAVFCVLRSFVPRELWR